MQTILLDTDYAINFLRGKSAIIKPLIINNTAFLSMLSVYEIYAGIRPGEEIDTSHFIQACRIEMITLDIAKNAGMFRYQQQKKGMTLSVVDCIIGETARLNNHLIATNNKKQYPTATFWP